MRDGLRRWAAVLVMAGVAAGLSSCSFASTACPGWVSFETPRAAADGAEAVVIGEVRELVGSRRMFGATANVWSVRVDRWETGEGPDRIEVASTPSQCGGNGDPYLGDGDPFDAARTAGPSAIFLYDDRGWRAVTPLQGIVPAPQGEIPAEWPAGSPGSPPPG